ncbi:hypothetical protein DL764_009910 [Monosporascus ibericus]|uniref:Uncharacterized protein n=1 Tax=Monosporascus ibericus TaxID=155417 RepID=A0A4Q4STU0_9PEZI|nr:hypothetical protein DL764_009910 [Monosporascus ibericus]
MPCFNVNSMEHSQKFRIALFGPQVTQWTLESLSDLQLSLLKDGRLDFLKATLAELPSTWSFLDCEFSTDDFPVLEKLQSLRGFATGAGDLDSKDLTNTQLAPLTVVSQLVDLIQSTNSSNIEEYIPDFEAAQGFCIGFLSAAVFASADNWVDFQHGASSAIRLAAHEKFLSQMRKAKLSAAAIGLSGCYHNPKHGEAADRLRRICSENDNLRLPSFEKLHLPLRSTVSGIVINHGSLHDIAIDVILCRRAHWFQTVKLTMNGVPADKVTFAPLGREACIPRSLSTGHRLMRNSTDGSCELEEIAVIGMACRFPKAENLEKFWQLLRKGDTGLGKVPLERFNPAELSREPKLANFWGNFLDHPDVFDHRFFGISGREAKSMDPQQRLVLQVAYEALESAGYFNAAPTSYEEDVGVYLGVGSVDYEDNVASDNANAFAATAGGVNVITSPTLHQNLAAASFLNPNGSSRAFDAEAGGYCRGEGSGIIVLKPLSKAIASGDTVLGVIAASSVNQNSNFSSITIPDSGSQSTLYNSVLSAARIAPKEVTYVEAHGTGTSVGDPIEYESVRLALTGPWRSEELFLGSVKDNIGHTEAASGVAGVIKTLLMMQYRTIPRQANFISLHPRIKASPSDKITVPKATQPWVAGRPVALVNNYGAAGSNAVLLLRASDAPLRPRKTTSEGQELPSPGTVYPFLLSAKTPSSLRSYIDELILYLSKAPTLKDVVYKISRSHKSPFMHRVAFTATNLESAITSLDNSDVMPDGSTTLTVKSPVVLCFGGQTGRKVTVSRDLYYNCDLFRGHLDECDAICRVFGLPSIVPSIFEDGETQDIIALHCMLLALQVSSAKCWIDCGLEVDTLIGHSFGQLAALCVAGSVSLEDAFTLVSGRARLIRDSWGLDGGAMLSVECDRQEVEAVVRQVNSVNGLHVDIACYNGPRSFVLAGDAQSIEKAQEQCQFFKTTGLRNTHAYHSYLADSILDDLETVAMSIDIRPPRMHVETCTANANWSRFTAHEIVQHTRQPVYFAEAIERIAARLPSAVWVEAGSTSPIIAMARRIVTKPDRSDVFIPMELGNSEAVSNLAKATCQLWKAGSFALYWLFHRSSQHRYQQVNIPPYQFDKIHHWIQYKPKSELKEASLVTLLRNSDSKGEYLFSVDISNAIFKLAVQGHAVTGHSLCPASMYIELAARCAKAVLRNSGAAGVLPHMEGISMSAPLGQWPDIAIFVRLSLRKAAQETWDFTVLSRRSTNGGTENRETVHARGHMSWVPTNDVNAARRFKVLQRFCTNRTRNLPSAAGLSGSMVYKMFSNVVEYATYYRGVQSVAASGNEAVGFVTDPPNRPVGLDAGICDPISLDNFLQVAGIHVNCLSPREDDEVFVCVELEEIMFSSSFMANRSKPRKWNVYTCYDGSSKTNVTNDILVCDSDSGNLDLAVIGATFKSVPFKTLRRSLAGVSRTTNEAITIVATPQDSDNEGLLDSAYDTGTPSVSGDGHEKQPFHDVDPLRPQLSMLPPSQAAVVHKQPPGKPSETSDILQSIRNMFASILEVSVEEIQPSSRLDDLGIDSLLTTEVLAEMEARFHVGLSQGQLASCTDVFSVSQLINPPTTRTPEERTEDDLAPKYESSDRLASGDSMPLSLADNHSANGDGQGSSQLAVIARERFTEAKKLYDQYAECAGFASFYIEAFRIQSELVVQYTVSGLAPLGCDLRALKHGDEVPAFRTTPKHSKLVSQLYKILEDAKLITKASDGVFRRTEVPVSTVPASTLHEELLRKFPKHASETKLLHTTAPKLAECPSGAVDPLALIFRDPAARTLLGDVYTNAPMFKTGTLLLARYLSSVLERVGGRCELRILELGAGTGGTSRHVIEALSALGPNYKFSYTFTDLSASLVANARRSFSKWPFMHYAVLDIEKDPEPQFLGSYDIILSTNCIHATKSLVQSTTNIRKMLRPGGVLGLVELTRNLYWFDLVFGLLEGWWLFNDGREHALADERRWEHDLRAAGFNWIDWSDSPSAESDVLRVITASPYKLVQDVDSASANRENGDHLLPKETVLFKEVDGLKLFADIYYPPQMVQPGRNLPVALMIHGGGHIMLSRNDIRPQQTDILLRSGFLPVSIDYRLCPETTLLEGPMVDVADALAWVRTALPRLSLSRRDVQVDADNVVAVGWSSGGHLAMTLAWTCSARQIRSPEAILAFYCPTDYEDTFWTTRNIPEGAHATGLEKNETYELDDRIWEGVYDSPITSYNVPPEERPLGGWLAPSDPRSRLALHMNCHGRTLHVLLNGLDKKARAQPTTTAAPDPERVAAASPLAQVRRGNYTTPTFLIHPRGDDLIPWQQAERTWGAMQASGTEAELRILEDMPHLFDIVPGHRSNEMAAEAVQEGYRIKLDESRWRRMLMESSLA